jgi:hypothetical protein
MVDCGLVKNKPNIRTTVLLHRTNKVNKEGLIMRTLCRMPVACLFFRWKYKMNKHYPTSHPTLLIEYSKISQQTGDVSLSKNVVALFLRHKSQVKNGSI